MMALCQYVILMLHLYSLWYCYMFTWQIYLYSIYDLFLGSQLFFNVVYYFSETDVSSLYDIRLNQDIMSVESIHGL